MYFSVNFKIQFDIQFDIQRMKGTIKQVGRYIVGDVVGEGSFGKVYKGIDRFDKSQVALKFISKRGKNKKQLEGLRSQNQMLKKICHKNIIKLLDFLETQNEMIIITQYAGQNLADVLQKKKKFSYEEVRAYCQQIFDALCYLDQNRIAHRDLKPQNILIQNEVIKICDFGFARKLSASTTFMNSLKGTPLYIAPEILGTGPLNYTKKVDVWSFGIIIFELLAGRPPFWAENLQKLKPKILYEKVRFPKEMPIQLRSLIDRMLQKNPELRADWQQLKRNSFFTSQPLRDISSNCSNILNKSPPKQNYAKILDQPPTNLKKQESQKQGNTPQQTCGKLVRLANAQDIDDIKKIMTDLNEGNLDYKKLRTDNNFYQKIMGIFSSYFSGQNLVSKQILNQITIILIQLLKKIKLGEAESANDIMKRKQLLFCVLKLTDQDTEPQSISNQLVLTGFLTKIHFDNISIDFQTDQDILQICIRQIQACRTLSCFANAAILLGVIASQAVMTLNNSEQFFVKIDEDSLLSTITQSFQPIPSKRVLLECIQKFIHTNQSPVTISKSQHSLKKIFRNMKQKVASTLLQKNFLIYNPLTIYKDLASVQTYAKILYQCVNVSEQFRKQFLKHNYWTDFLQHKVLRTFCFAYDYICIQKDKTCLIPNEVMKSIAISESNKKSLYMENAFFLARAEFYLSRKQIQTSNKQQSTIKLLKQICELLSIDEQAKKKASWQVQGFLFSGQRIYEEVLGQTFCNILNDQMFDKSGITEHMIQIILEQALNYKSDEELKVSLLTATRIITGVEQLVRTQPSKMRMNKKIITMLGDIIGFFLDNGLIYQLQNQNGPALTRKFIFSMFNIIKMHSIPSPQTEQKSQKSILQKKSGIIIKKQSEKQLTRKQSQKQQKMPLQKQMQQKQSDLYLKAELRGIHNLLISDALLDKYTLTLCLTLFLKLISQNKCTDAIIDFTGITLMDKFKNYFKLDLDDKDSEIIVQILHLTSLVIKKNEEYAQKIKQIQIISHFPRYLQHPNNQNVRQQTLTLIGNMAKHSPYFFDDFANNAIFPCVVDTYKRFGAGNKNKILKGIVYAVGNVSFYTDRFSSSFTLLIPCLYGGLQTLQLIPNTISTISNLLRHSNIYVKTLIQHQIFKKVLQIISQIQRQDILLLSLNMIKKALLYPEIFQAHPKSQFIAMYKQKVKIVGEDNQCMKKIRTFM